MTTTITNVEQGDWCFYATANGRDVELSEMSKPGPDDRCEICGQKELYADDEDGDCLRSLYCDGDGRLVVCSDCIKAARR